MRLDRDASIARQERLLNTPPERPVPQSPAWRRAIVWPLAALIRIWAGTIRVAISQEDLDHFQRRGEPILFVLWHNRLFLAADLYRRYRGDHPLHGLVSASRDGAWLSAFFSVFGIKAIRGSSSKLGRESAGSLVSVLREGCDVGITPDGPRGPVYEVKPGASVIGRRAGVTVLLAGLDFEAVWRLPSWDGFILPKPFSRVHLRMVVLEPVPDEDREESARRMGRILAEINPDRKPLPVKKPARP
jgi:lysophospholipid acyltransferase (LPLAT)-like uncharacterized protein